MTTITDANVFNVAVKGTFDDCQSIVKALFSDADFNAKHSLGAINSINWARILAQITYYFHSYFALLRARRSSVQQALVAGLHVQYCVPTGNFGDILAGWYARRLGLPTAKLVVATNENDILARFWQTGHYELAAPPSDEAAQSAQTEKVQGASDGQQAQKELVKATLAPAMDILVSSNFERLLWYYAFEQVAEGESEAQRQEAAGKVLLGWMRDLKEGGSVKVGEGVHGAASREFSAQRVSDKEVCCRAGRRTA
jgi:threonine synthase